MYLLSEEAGLEDKGFLNAFLKPKNGTIERRY